MTSLRPRIADLPLADASRKRKPRLVWSCPT